MHGMAIHYINLKKVVHYFYLMSKFKVLGNISHFSIFKYTPLVVEKVSNLVKSYVFGKISQLR